MVNHWCIIDLVTSIDLRSGGEELSTNKYEHTV